MAFSQVTLSGTVEVGNALAAAGAAVTFTLNTPISDGVRVVAPNPLTVTCGAGGAFSITLNANDDPTTSPTGSFYTVEILYEGQQIVAPFDVIVPSAMAGTGANLFALGEMPSPATVGASYVGSVTAGPGVVVTPSTGAVEIAVADSVQQASALAQMNGVVADGATDNYTTIAAALATLSSGGKCPPLPPGVIGVSRKIVVPAGVTLCGSGTWDDIGPEGSLYGTKIVPLVAGLTTVVELDNNMSGIEDLTVDGLLPANAHVAQHAVYVNATGCKARNVCFLGGSSSTLFGNATNATQFLMTDFTIRTNDNTGACQAVNTTGNDWQCTQGLVNGCAGSTLDGPNSTWTNVHFVSGTSVSTTGALIRDGGAQDFDGCYFDGNSGGAAMIDRTGAIDQSIYTNSLILQSCTGVTGMPIFLETTTGGAGVIIVGLRTRSIAAGSSYTNFIAGAIATTQVSNISVKTGWLTGSLASSSTPLGYWNGAMLAGVAQDYPFNVAVNGSLAALNGFRISHASASVNTTISTGVGMFLSQGSAALTHRLTASDSQVLVFVNQSSQAATINAPSTGSAPTINGAASLAVAAGAAVILIGTSAAAGTWIVASTS